MSTILRFDAHHEIEVTEDLEGIEAAVSMTGGMGVPLARLTLPDGSPVLIHSRTIRTVSPVHAPAAQSRGVA